MPTRNVNLTTYLDRFVAKGVSSGRFSNASEVVRAGLRLLQQREREDRARVARLRAAVKKGTDAVEAGDFTVLNSDQEVTDFVNQVSDEVFAESAPKRRRR